MKKILTLLVVLGLAGIASASYVAPDYVGELGYGLEYSVPGAVGTEPGNKADYSDIIELDINARYASTALADRIKINASGTIFLEILGPGEFVYATGEYGSLESRPDITTSLDDIGVSYYSGWDFVVDAWGTIVQDGYNIMIADDSKNLRFAGGFGSVTQSERIDADGVLKPSELEVFDHIGVHCLGEGDVTVVLTVGTAGQLPGGSPVIDARIGGAFQGIGDEIAGEGDSIIIYQVPEPVTIALLGLGGLALIRRKRA